MSSSGTGGKLTAVLNRVAKLRLTEVSSKQRLKEDMKIWASLEPQLVKNLPAMQKCSITDNHPSQVHGLMRVRGSTRP